MTSTDREILIEINGRIKNFERETEQRFTVIERRLDILETRIEGLQTSVYWVFAGIGILLAISTIFLAVLPFLRRDEKGATISDMIALINFGRNQDSSKPINDTRSSPDKTASS